MGGIGRIFPTFKLQHGIPPFSLVWYHFPKLFLNSSNVEWTSASSAPSPEESLINTQQRSQIERYIELLPQQYRRLFVMRFIDDFSYEEIAEKLHMPMGTVKTRIHRARERMCRFIIEGEKA